MSREWRKSSARVPANVLLGFAYGRPRLEFSALLIGIHILITAAALIRPEDIPGVDHGVDYGVQKTSRKA